MPNDNLPAGLDPATNRMVAGKLYTRIPNTQNVEAFTYRGPASGFQTLEDAQAADEADGQWVEGSTKNPNGISIGKILAIMAAAGAGGSALAGLAGVGAGAGAAGAAAGAAPAAAALPAATIGLAGAGGGAGAMGAIPAVAGGLAGGVAPAVAAGLPAATIGLAGAGGGSGAMGAIPAVAGGLGTSSAAVAPAAAATGGLVSKIAPLATAAGKGFGAMASARASGRAQQQQANQGVDQLQTQRDIANAGQGNTAAGIDLQQRQFAADQAKTSLSQALRGGLLQGTQDVSINVPEHLKSHMATITGGARPSALLGKEQIGADLQRQALLNLMDPANAGGGPMPSLYTTGGMKAPASSINFAPLTPMPKPNALDTFLQYAGPAATMGGAFFG